MLKERIEILKNGGVISQEVADFVNHTIDVIVKDYPQVNEDAAAMFTTHLAMAAERIRRGEVVEELDEAVWQDVVECPEYETGCRLIEQLFPISLWNFRRASADSLCCISAICCLNKISAATTRCNAFCPKA